MSAATVAVIGTVATVAGTVAKTVADAKAAKAQQAATKEALQYSKGLDQNSLQQSANRYATLAGALGMPTTQPNAPTPMLPGGIKPLGMQPGTPTSTGPPGSAVPRAPAPMTPHIQASTVLMQAPNGSTKQVPASEQQHWTSLGAKVVG